MISLGPKIKLIKKTQLWKFIIQFIFYPIYNLFWQYILNFQAKILYFLWILKKKNYIDLSNNDKILVKDNNDFINLSQKILYEVKPLLENSKNKILSSEFKETLSKKIGPTSVEAELPYRISLYEQLSENLKKEIINFASSEFMITTAAKHMKIFPILTRVQVDHNIPRPEGKIRGAMYWHRDTFGFKNLDFFMAVTDIDDNNGPFYCLEKKIRAGTFLAFSNVVSNFKKGERGKVSLEEFSNYFKNENILKLSGNSGSAIFLDSFSCYHRGGYCKERERVTLRLCYQSHDALYNSSIIDNNYYKYDDRIRKNETIDIFKKYLFFKNPSLLMRSLSKKIVNIYRKLDFEV